MNNPPPFKYKIVKTNEQYTQYCKLPEQPLESGSPEVVDEVELLNLLIEKWDDEHNSHYDMDPIAVLKHLMSEHGLLAKDLSGILGVGKGLVSDILNYKKGLSKEAIRVLAAHFKVSQELFNRPYLLTIPTAARNRPAKLE